MFNALLEAQSERTATLQPVAFQEITPTRTTLRCPDDSECLYAVRRRGLEFHECRACAGLFLEPSQLRSLLDRTRRAGHQLAAARRSSHDARVAATLLSKEPGAVTVALDVLVRMMTPFA